MMIADILPLKEHRVGGGVDKCHAGGGDTSKEAALGE